jgi:MFS-type transporter involved in bile tolerance (Atg22 family)
MIIFRPGFLYNAVGFSTITSTAVLFGKTTLGMQPSQLILIGAITPCSGILGSLVWPILQRRYGWTNLKVLIILVIMTSMVPLYGCLGFLPLFKHVGFGGLTTHGEMFGLAVYFGICFRSSLVVISHLIVVRIGIRRVPGLRKSILCGTTSPRGRSEVVRSLLHN